MSLSEADLAAVEEQASALRAQGWAPFVTYKHLLSSWRRLCGEVATYPATIDDFTNDLTSRTGLDLIRQRCEPVLAIRVGEHLAHWDEVFRDGTDPDPDGLIADFYRVTEESGWWFRRIPKTGTLRVYLDDWGRERPRR